MLHQILLLEMTRYTGIEVVSKYYFYIHPSLGPLPAQSPRNGIGSIFGNFILASSRYILVCGYCQTLFLLYIHIYIYFFLLLFFGIISGLCSC